MQRIPNRLERAIAAGGNAGALVAAHDWDHSALGPMESWPATLSAAVSMCLTTGFPMVVNWGRQLTQIYNDAAIPVYGDNHPAAMGRPARDNFPEFWELMPIQALIDNVFKTARPFRAEDQRLLVYRRGVLVETYFTFSFSPIIDDDGTVLGFINTYVETTDRVLGERRMATLRALAERAVYARRPSDACTEAVAALATNPYDLRFVLLYLVDHGGDSASLSAACGIDGNAAAAPRTIGTRGPNDEFAWPVAEVLESRRSVVVENVPSQVDLGTWPGRRSKPKDALVLPLVRSADAPAIGVLVVGLSPRMPLDESYRSFLELCASQIATGIGSAEAYEEARERAQRLADLDRAKDVFYSNISHEFRTPLTLLLAPVDDLLREQSGPLNAVQREALGAVLRNATRLRRLVNGLLDLASLEAGRLELDAEPTDLAQLTREIASTVEPSMASAGLELVVDCPPLPRKASIDNNAWETIVLNLLSNARNYTKRGRVTVQLRAVDGRIRLVVSDTGIGISPSVLPHIFDRFYRAPEAGARSVEGTGIGLALVRELARTLGGDVSATSTPGKGSSFSVEVPFNAVRRVRGDGTRARVHARVIPDLPESAELAEELPQAPTRSSDGSRPRVLVVEDNADMRQYIARILSEEYDVHAVADGNAALASLASFSPDLVLSDVLVPGIDGLALVRALRAAPDTREIPAILITARTSEDAVLEGLRSGADDYIMKPFFSRELRARIHTHMELARMRRDAGEAAMKDTFIGMISHELRTPLTSLKLQLTVLSEETEKVSSLSARVVSLRRAVARLEALVDDLLNFSAMKAGVLEIRRERTNLCSICKLAAEEQILIARRDIAVEMPPDPCDAVVDPRLIHQVVSNLLSNALKYSEADRPVTLRLENRADEAVISVQDQGPGISPDVVPHLFDQFYRAPSIKVRSGSRTGLGLGLAITQAIVHAHGGRIEVDSAVGRGSTFSAHIPLVDVEQPAEDVHADEVSPTLH